MTTPATYDEAMTRRDSNEEGTSPLRTNLSATVIGTLVTLAGLAMALTSAQSINLLAHHDIGAGLALLATIVAVRWIEGELVDRWSTRIAQRLRHQWRQHVLTFFLLPSESSSASPVDIADAVDIVADEPRLMVVRASARASILSLFFIWWTGGWQALGVVIVLLAIAVPLYQRAGTRAAALDAQHRERRTRLGQRQLELLAHAPELRALGAVEYATQEISALSDSEHQVALRAIHSALGSSLVTEFLSGVSVGLVAMSVGFGLLNGRISLLRAVIAVLVTSEFFGNVRRYGIEFHQREAVASARQRLEVPTAPDSASGDVLEIMNLVTHAHPGVIDLRIPPGERVAVLGASGVGKTTLAHTVLGWRTPKEGHVRRANWVISYVSAETPLIEGSLSDNLCLGRDISYDVVREKLNAVGLRDGRFDDLRNLVSADGGGFSSGERVRLVLARGLLHQPQLVILDDVAGLLDETARQAIRRELLASPDLAVIEVAVDGAIFINATTTVRLS